MHVLYVYVCIHSKFIHIQTYTYTYKQITHYLLILYCMNVYVYVCMSMNMYVLYVCVCIVPVFMIYLYAWPRFSVDTPPSHQKVSRRGGTDWAGLSTPMGMCPNNFAGILRPCSGPILAHLHSKHALGGVKAHLCRCKNASCGQMRYIGPA